MMWAAQEIPEMNALGAERLIRNLAVMQGPLTALTTTESAGDDLGGASKPSVECQRAFERATGYYTLITLPAEEVARLAADKPLRYSVAEWEALLSVSVPGRPGGDASSGASAAALRRSLNKAYNISAARKVGAALEELGGRVQAPVASLTDSITAGFKGGVLQAQALLKQAAEATTAAAHTVAEATTAAVQQATEAASSARGATGTGTGAAKPTGGGAGAEGRTS